MLKILKNNIYIKFLLLILIFLFSQNIFAQTDKLIDTTSARKDTLNPKIMQEILRMTEEYLVKESISKNKDRQNRSNRITLISNIKKEITIVENYFKKGIDTVSLNNDLKVTESVFRIASEGIFINISEPQTTRNLTTTAILLNELLKLLEVKQKKVAIFLTDLHNFRSKIDSLSNDTILYKIPKDTSLFKEYFKTVNEVFNELNPIDSSLNLAIRNLNDIDDNINGQVSNLKSSLQSIEAHRLFISQNLFARELPNIGKPVVQNRSFWEIGKFSIKKGSMVLFSFIGNNKTILVILLISILIIFYFLKKSKDYVINNENLKGIFPNEITLKYPVLSSVFIALILFLFIFSNPPVVFQGIILIIASVILAIIFWFNVSKTLRHYWIFSLLIFTIAIIWDLILEVSEFERWSILILALTGIVTGTIVLIKNHSEKILVKNHIYLILASITFELISFAANIFGRFNFSKVSFVSGYLIIISWVLLVWSRRLIIQSLAIRASIIENAENELLTKKFRKLNQSLPDILKYFVIIGWIIMIARHFYLYDNITNKITEFLQAEQTIWKYNFTMESILVFVLIIFLSAIASKSISFYTDTQIHNKKNITPFESKSGISNWFLIIKIAIVTAGILLAFAAAGLPMDRLTIIIGSLGVGIGFGLQTIIGNLISGILLSFERPVQIGDQIEVEGKVGIIKEIGIRSSKIATFEGSDVIIPNGDMLSKHVINWTRTNNQRRVELLIGVKYGTDLKKCKDILERIVNENELVDKNPAPLVLLNEFKTFTIEFRLLLWANILKWTELKSEIILNIENEFKKARIEISFPLQKISDLM